MAVLLCVECATLPPNGEERDRGEWRCARCGKGWDEVEDFYDYVLSADELGSAEEVPRV